MAEQSMEDTKIVVQHLKRKEKESPMSEYEKIKHQLAENLMGDE
jgi:pilus assembly protein CpaF